MDKVLLLNASYEPLNICSWRRAIVLLLKGKAEQIECNGNILSQSINSPAVIRLRYYVVVPYKELPFNRKNVFHRDNHTCQYCGKHTSELSLDHVIPRSKGGKTSWENVVTACVRCNSLKADKTLQETNLKLARKPQQPSNYIKFELTKYSSELFDQWDKYTAG